MHTKPPQTILLVTIILTIILTAVIPLPPQTRATDKTEQDQKTKAAFLISTFNTANNSITQTILNLKAKNTLIPQVSTEIFREAQVLAEDASILNQQGNYSKAIDSAMQALQKLKDTLTSIYEIVEDTPTEQEAIQEQTANLRSTINRYYTLFRKLENMTISVSSRETNVSEANSTLTELKAVLDEAASNLNQGNLDNAKVKAEKAQTLIDKLNAYFSTLAASFKIERVAAYIAEAEQRLNSLSQQLNSVSSQLTPSTQAASSAALTEAKKSLTQAKQYLDSEQIDQTIDELTTVKENAETVTNYINTVIPKPTPTPTQNSTRSNSTSNVDEAPTSKSIKP